MSKPIEAIDSNTHSLHTHGADTQVRYHYRNNPIDVVKGALYTYMPHIIMTNLAYST